MLSSQQTNSDFTDANQLQQNQQQSQQKNFTEMLKNSVEGFSKLPAQKQMLAVGAVGAIFSTALPLLAAALPLAAVGAVAALTLFLAVKVVSYAVQGMKWSANMVVKGAKHSKDEVIKGYKHSRDSLKRGASFVKEQTKETTSNMLHATANKLYNAAGKENYGDKLDKFTPEEKAKSKEIIEDIKAIFADQDNNTGLIKSILSEVASKIDSKIASKIYGDFRDYLPDKDIDRLQEQKKFISNLSEKDLHSLLTKRSLPKDKYFINGIFSEHYDQIKEVIAECKENHLLLGVNNMFDKAERKANKPSLRSVTRSISSFSPLGRKSSNQSTSSVLESSSSDSSSVRTESTASSEAELLNSTEHKNVEQTTSLRSKVSSWFRKNKVADIEVNTDIGYRSLSDPELDNIATIGTKRSHSSIAVASPAVPNGFAPQKPPRAFMTSSHSLESLDSSASFLSASSELSGSESAHSFSSYRRHSDSGVSSPGSSTPKRSSSMRNINSPHLSQIQEAKKSLKKTGSFEKLVPSSRVTTQAEVHAQPTQVAASQVSVKG